MYLILQTTPPSRTVTIVAAVDSSFEDTKRGWRTCCVATERRVTGFSEVTGRYTTEARPLLFARDTETCAHAHRNVIWCALKGSVGAAPHCDLRSLRVVYRKMLQTVLAATALAGLLFISGGNYDKLIPTFYGSS